MIATFEECEQAFAQQQLCLFNGDARGILWLKLRAIARKKQLSLFTSQIGFSLTSKTIKQQTKELYQYLCNDVGEANKSLDFFLRNAENELYAALNVNLEELKADLYKIQDYVWGGDYTNSLDRYLIKSYVKGVASFQSLLAQKEVIAENAWHYVKNSWYNHWTSYLIESIFKTHERVVSAVGAIKSVDFFIDDIPIDLKVTYFPSLYMDKQFRELTGISELSWLKRKANERELRIPQHWNNATLEYFILERFEEMGAIDVLDERKKIMDEILHATTTNPESLMHWLYINQGEMRFGAENRLFIILINQQDYSQSWKLKRAFELLKPKIDSYLTTFTASQLTPISFSHQGRNYKALADTLFIVK